MSASETGDEAPLVQFFSSVRNKDSASAPASRTVFLNSRASRVGSLRVAIAAFTPSELAPAKRQSFDSQRRRIDAIAKLQIVGGHQRFEDMEKVTCDRHLAHRIGDLAVLDPEAGGAAAVVTRHAVDAGADEIGDIETLPNVGDQLGRGRFAGLEMKVVGSWRRRGGHPAMSVTRRGHSEFARGCTIEQPRGENAFVDDRELFDFDALGVERLRTQSSPAQRVVDNADVLCEQLLAEPIL